MEEQLPEADEDAFGVRELSFVMLVDGDADNCCHACTNHGQEHPTDTDTTTLLSLRGRTQCHEADDDVRLTEVAEAPRERRHDAEDCCAGQGAFTVSEREDRRIDAVHFAHQIGEATNVDDAHNRHQDERDQHHDALNDVGPRHGKEATDQRVQHCRRSDDDHTQVVVHTE